MKIINQATANYFATVAINEKLVTKKSISPQALLDWLDYQQYHGAVLKGHNISTKSCSKNILEVYAMNTANIDDIEYNELFANIKEYLEDDINSQYEYWNVRLNDIGKAVELIVVPEEEIWFDDFCLDAQYIFDTPYEEAAEMLEGVSKENYDIIRQEVMQESSEIDSKVLPRIARRYNFRKRK